MTALIFIISSLLHLLVLVFLLRVLLPLCGVDYRHPFSAAILRLTNPLVLPMRRFLPAMGRIDTASWVALLLIQLASTLLITSLSGIPPHSIGQFLFASLRALLSVLLQFYLFVLMFHAVMSWMIPHDYNPASSLLRSLSAPVLKPFQRFIPRIAGLDLSVLFALIAIQALLILIGT
jgi:YggT family protein